MRPKGELNAKLVENVVIPGRYRDGLGLYLTVRPGGSKSWVLRVQKDGRRHDYGLGGWPKVSLATARELARNNHDKLARGIDLKKERRKYKQVPTFAAAARERFEEVAETFRNSKHRDQWINTLTTYAFPYIGEMRVDEIDAADVRILLMPIWITKQETARRVRQRVGDVLAFAKSRKWRPDLPNLSSKELTLPAQRARTQHHAALPFELTPSFMAQVRKQAGVSALALEFIILTAARSEEARGATWGEIDLVGQLWVIPKDRMKTDVEHAVPLSPAACAVLQKAKQLHNASIEPGSLIFPSPVKSGALSDTAVSKVVKLLAGKQATVHGFRSTFRDWGSETTDFANEVGEKALAHAIDSKTEAAYRRGALLKKRRAMMDQWATYLDG